MSAFLVPLDNAGCVIPLEKAILLIGRQADCDVALTVSRKVSRRHCAIAVVNNTVVVRDLGSTNGVSVNGARVEREAKLSLGDEVTIGDVRFRLQREASLARPASGPNGKRPQPASPQAPAAPNPDSPLAFAEDGSGFGVEPAALAKRRTVNQTAGNVVDSGPLVPYQPTASDYQPMSSDSV